MTAAEPKLVLIGGGHAHLAVLADWIRHGPPAGATTLVTPATHLRYSGMVPGWIAGQYDSAEGRVDIASLARRAGVQLVLDRCVGVDPDNCRIRTGQNGEIEYDFCSFNTGGVGQAQSLLGHDSRILDVRPIEGLLEGLGTHGAIEGSDCLQIAIIGGGAGGLELAFALNNRRAANPHKITLIAGDEGLLPGFGAMVRRMVRRELARQDIALIERNAELVDGVVHAGSAVSTDLIIAALGSGAPEWPAQSGIEVDAKGFVAVDKYQASLSHPAMFAVGDIAARQDIHVTHSGVHAVHTGPVLAANLRQALAGKAPTHSYRPRPASLYLLATGNGSAIGSYGPLAVQGKWVHRLKQWIDKRWTSSYAKLAQGV